MIFDSNSKATLYISLFFGFLLNFLRESF